MKKILFFILLGWIGLIVWTGQVQAQDEQWLQYHSAREVSLIGFSSYTLSLNIIKEKPQGLELPALKSDKPLFAKWNSPMVKNGFLWIVLDKTKAAGNYDNLYIDSNGDGKLSDESAVTAYQTTQTYIYFGPVKVTFALEDGPVSYHLNFRYYSSGSTQILSVLPGGWYEGDITVNGSIKHCVLFDYNVNGSFNDKSSRPEESDRIRIGKANNQSTAVYVGKYIDVNGVLYEPQIARDGAYIKLAEVKNVQYGKVRLPESVSQLSVGGENGLFVIKSSKGVSSLPAGEYKVIDWTIEYKDSNNTLWKLQAASNPGDSPIPGKKDKFTIAEANETSLSLGEPIISILTETESSGTHSFSQSLKGRNEERITLTRNGSQPQAPKLTIKNADGSYDRTYSFSYG
jgi:hypothetical protein